MTPDTPEPRSCGDCQACCTNLGIAELEKPAFTACSHLCDDGCAVYEGRPEECRSFDCVWLIGWGPDQARPDLSGIVLEQVNESQPMGTTVQASTTTPDDEQTPMTHSLIGALLREEVSVIIRRKDGARKLVGTPKMASKARLVLKRELRKKRRRTKTRIPRGKLG